MPNIDPALAPALNALVRGLRGLNISFCIVGALVPELLLETKPAVRTNDVDAVVLVPDLAAFEAVKTGLTGFSRTKHPHRLSYREGGLVDILPYSPELTPDGLLRLPPDLARVRENEHDEWKPRREELFLWYRRGLGL